MWCEIDYWRAWRTAGSDDSPGGVQVEERRLRVTFLNQKDVDVTVWDMRVAFYNRGGKLLEEWERPYMEFSNDSGGLGSPLVRCTSPRVYQSHGR